MRTAAARRAFAVAGIVLAFALLAFAVRVAYPAQLADSPDVARIERAAARDRGNDAIQYQLGLAEEWEAGNTAAAVQRFRRATELNPRRVEYWSDLAQSCYVAGDLNCAEAAYDTAVRLAPMRPRNHWDQANFFLVTGRRDQALAAFSSLLAVAPENSRSALDLCLRAYRDPALEWDRVVRPLANPRVALMFLALMEERQAGDTAQYWAETRNSHFSFASAAPYVDALLANGSYDLAARVWKDLQAAGTLPAQAGDAIYNGDFETPPLNAGFDWHFYSPEFVEVSLDHAVAHTGHASMRIDFSVPRNDDYAPVFDVVPVASGQPTTLTAWVKSDSITSDSGPRLRVVDPRCAACLDVSSESTTGTTDWHQIQLPFTPGADTKAVRIMVWRGRSRTYPMDISGTFWLDTVALAPSK